MGTADWYWGAAALVAFLLLLRRLPPIERTRPIEPGDGLNSVRERLAELLPPPCSTSPNPNVIAPPPEIFQRGIEGGPLRRKDRR